MPAATSAAPGRCVATDVGRVAPGMRADLCVLDAPSYTHLVYRPGVPLVHRSSSPALGRHLLGCPPVARTPDLERRQELLDRIVVYLAENGLAQATLRPMAASLDVSINRLVHHFGSKEELLATALQRAIEQQIAVQDAWLARNPRLTMVELYRKWWRWMNESPRQPRRSCA